MNLRFSTAQSVPQRSKRNILAATMTNDISALVVDQKLVFEFTLGEEGDSVIHSVSMNGPDLLSVLHEVARNIVGLSATFEECVAISAQTERDFIANFDEEAFVANEARDAAALRDAAPDVAQ